MTTASIPPKSYIGRVGQALSQLGNALANGNPDVSISARIGHKQRRNWYWRMANAIVDFSFYPMEGPGHCDRAWRKDMNEMYIIQGHWLPFVVLTTIFCTACSILIPLSWTIGLAIGKKGGAV